MMGSIGEYVDLLATYGHNLALLKKTRKTATISPIGGCMGLLNMIFGKKTKKAAEHAVLVYLDGTGLPEKVYEECDTSTIEDLLIDVLEKTNLGEFDGHGIGDTETVLFLYGSDGEKLFTGIEATLRSYPLCQGARVVIRSGAPGAAQREFRL